jgi:hypothetical protein
MERLSTWMDGERFLGAVSRQLRMDLTMLYVLLTSAIPPTLDCFGLYGVTCEV